jgi:protein-S-isoprenylcysteine O-methyltransferase Ste14
MIERSYDPMQERDGMSAREKRHEERDDLTGEHALTDIGQLVLAVVFLVAWVLDSFVLQLTTQLNAHVPLAARLPIAFVFLALAAYLGTASHRTIFGETREEPHVVRTGVFAIVRHPMYLSEILFYFGLLAASISLIAGGAWLLVIGFLHGIARREESLLLKRFGNEYARYRRDVGMWVPRLHRRR